jgi:amino acid transporter
MSSYSGELPAAASAGVETAPTLKKNEVGLLGSTVFALAGAAPGQTVSIVLASLVAASAYATILPLAISALGLLCIAVAFQRLNMWRQNAGGRPTSGRLRP